MAFLVIDHALGNGLSIEAFGHECPEADSDWRRGSSGDVVYRLHLDLRRRDVWPHRQHAEHYDLDTLFDVIEFLYEHASKPAGGDFADYCGHVHWYEFDRDAGRAEFRDEINKALRLAESPVALDLDGHIRYLPDDGFNQMLGADLPPGTPDTVRSRVDAAIVVFKGSRSEEGLRHAVRDLADALEAVRTDVRVLLDKKDEKALFETFNRFGIRHLKETDRLDYRPAFLRWLFYVALATIHLTLRMAGPSAANERVTPELDAITLWPRVLDDLKETAPAVRGFLEGSRLVELTPHGILVAVMSKVRESMLLHSDNVTHVEAAVERVAGRTVQVRYVADAPSAVKPTSE